MKRYIVLILALCCLMACGCGAKTEAPEATPAPAAEPEVTDVTEAPAEASEGPRHIAPLPQDFDPVSLFDCILPVSFEEGDAYMDDKGDMYLSVQFYTYDLYDMVDMAQLQVGDTITILKEDVTVESLERTESGDIIINGGIEMGGHQLSTDESGVFFERGFNDAKSYYSLGEAVFPVSDKFVFTDSSDLDKEPVEYSSADLLAEESGIVYHFVPANTSIRLEGGQVVEMQRVYIP